MKQKVGHFILEEEPWFKEMVRTRYFPPFMVPPRMGMHPVRQGEKVVWVKTFWQRMSDLYNLRWRPEEPEEKDEEREVRKAA